MAFEQFRPTSHFIAPHSWSNDPCGAVFIPEVKEYIFCYQWNPGTTDGGNCAWGMAKSKDLVTWRDCPPAITNGTSYDAFGVFSGSIVSRLVEGKRVLFLFYTSISAVPIHWSKPYIEGCESQSVAFSTDFGKSWHRYENNPLLSLPPKGDATTGWRDPFVSQWAALSDLLNVKSTTNYMMIASGERGRGSQLHLYQSDDLLEWRALTTTILNVQAGSKVSAISEYSFGMNFECASFFSLNGKNYIIVGIEEDEHSKLHNGHRVLWLCGDICLEDGQPRFQITSHGALDHGISYAAHIFHDSESRLLQLGWADEAAKQHVVKSQGWAGTLLHPREIFEISKPISQAAKKDDIWSINQSSGTMTTLGIRPAPQISCLRPNENSSSLAAFNLLRSTNYEVEATFAQLCGTEKFIFNVRESPNSSEITKLIFDLKQNIIMVDRSLSSLEDLGTNTPDSGRFQLLPGEDLHLRIFVDKSLVEIYANDRFALSSRIYPSLDTSIGVSYDFGEFDEGHVAFKFWEGLKNAWPERNGQESMELQSLSDVSDETRRIDASGLLRQPVISA